MANQIFQAFDPYASAITTDYYGCRIWVSYAHKVVSAKIITQKTVTTGTVVVYLRQTDSGDGKGGAQVGETLVNADLGDVTDTIQSLDFTLATADKQTAPAGRMYFLVLTGTNSADRVEAPGLILTVDDLL